MKKTKIEWCDFTWNPVWGCINDCQYCYARKIAKRFYNPISYKEHECRKKLDYKYCGELSGLQATLKYFSPTFLESNYDKQFPKKPCRIFVNSMSDIAYWKPEWMERVLDKIKDHPQHTFIFLTKEKESIYNHISLLKNCWSGVTLTNSLTFYKQKHSLGGNRFVSIEPIQSHIEAHFLKWFDWVIIGAETGNRKDRVIPKKEWIENIVNFCQQNKIPVFMKNSLKNIWEKELIQEFPKELTINEKNA